MQTTCAFYSISSIICTYLTSPNASPIQCTRDYVLWNALRRMATTGDQFNLYIARCTLTLHIDITHTTAYTQHSIKGSFCRNDVNHSDAQELKMKTVNKKMPANRKEQVFNYIFNKMLRSIYFDRRSNAESGRKSERARRRERGGGALVWPARRDCVPVIITL